MINVSQLVFDYPGTRALDDVSFSVERGAIVALVGPNGAGKTTLLSCLAGLEAPYSGSITLDGIDVMQEPRACHRKVGYLAMPVECIRFGPQTKIKPSPAPRNA